MKAKTKDQLRKEISDLQVENYALKQKANKMAIGVFRAFEVALGSTLKSEKYVASKDGYDVLAYLTTNFFAELKRETNLDITVDSPESLERTCYLVGFDDVTAMVIKQRIPLFYEMSRMINEMVREGKSDEEIMKIMKELIKKYKKDEGRE